MSGKLQKIKITNLINLNENPRHSTGENEKDTLKKLFTSVGNQYMLNLAKDIHINGLLGSQHIVVVPNGGTDKYIVYEGNRRLAAIKLLANPELFDFLDKPTIQKVKKFTEGTNKITEILCYVTSEEEAYRIMERVHSGEDKGRGTKTWGAKEKENFNVLQNKKKSMPYLIDFYVKEYFDNFDITSLMAFTTLQRIFGNPKVKNKIGLDITNEDTFTVQRITIVKAVIEKIVKEANEKGIAVTRLYNYAVDVEKNVIPMIDDLLPLDKNNEVTQNIDDSPNIKSNGNKRVLTSNVENSTQTIKTSDTQTNNISQPKIMVKNGSSKNTPYFFQGLNYSNLHPSDSDSHGVSAICKELVEFSNKKLVDKYPIATVYLVRAIIEQSLIYYSKKHKIQAQNKFIWKNIENETKLFKIIKNYNDNLPNYITDPQIRQYFTNLFSNYEDTIDPLNWVVHRPSEFQLDANTLIELPKKGLLSLINYFLS